MAHAEELSLYSETEFEAKAPDGFAVSCPTLDLSATWHPESRALLIYRPPDQVVSKIQQLALPGRKAPEVCAVTWKPDGQFLALGWSDGVVRLMGLENNKAAHSIAVSEEASGATISHIGWSASSIADASRGTLPGALQDRLSGEWAGGRDRALLNLPQELTFLEVETALPRISPLPASSAGSGEDATVFTMRSGTEFLFQTPKRDTYDQVNIMVVGTRDGRVQLSIYDSFVIGSFACPTPDAPASFMTHHASHPQVSTHALTFAEKRAEPDEIRLVPMDMPFISSSPINLSLLSSKVTTFQVLLRYLKQAALHMTVEWRNAKELPGRFIRAVQADLEAMETGPNDIVPALYHTLLTGHAHLPLREWLLDSLAERGHKRWDKAVVSGLEGLRSLVHQNFLPALERCAIILSRLSGLARFHDDRDDIGFSLSDTDKALAIVGALTLVGHRILVLAMDELQHFRAFSAWLRFQIDRLASPASAKDELTEKEATMDNAKVLAYIERYLTRSPLDVFFGDIAPDDSASAWAFLEAGSPAILDALDRQFQQDPAGGAGAMKALPHPEFLVHYATTWSNRIFANIADATRKGVRFGVPVTLSIGRPISRMHTRMCSPEKNTGILITALASHAEPSKIHIFRAHIAIVDGISESQPHTTCSIDLKRRSVLDLCFLNDTTLIALCNDASNHPVIVCVPIAHEDLAYTPYVPAAPRPRACSGKMATELRLPRGCRMAGARPARMEVREQSDARGHIPARIVLLAGDESLLSSFTLPELISASGSAP